MTPSKLLRLVMAAGVVGALLLVMSAARAAPGSGPSLAWSTATPTTPPPYLAYAAGAYDPATKTFVMFGGITADGVMSGTTWIWNGSDWTEYSGGPSPRDLSSVGFDPELDQFVLFGGQTAQGNLLSDTWTWNGSSWYQISSSLPAPTSRDGATLAYDRDGRLVLFGGTGYATPTGTAPVGSGGGVAPAETTLADTWLWQGSTDGWTLDKVPGPTPRSGAVSAYDVQNGTTVVFGGESTPASAAGQPQLLDDTWLWNGKTWTDAKPPASPPARFAAVADDFQPLGGPIVAGGYGSTGDLSDTWLWQGGSWAQLSERGANPDRQGAAGAYDTAANEFVVFGGTSGGDPLDLTSVAKLAPVTPPSTTTTTISKAPSSTTSPPKEPTTTSTTAPAGGHQPSSPTTTFGPPQRPPTAPVSPRTGPILTTASARVAKGGRLELSGSGFTPGATVVLTLHSDPTSLGTVRVGPAGRFDVTVTVPATVAPGAHQVSAVGPTPAGKVLTASVDVNVLSPAKGLSTRAKTFLLGLALLIPVVTYAVMMLYGLGRNRRASGLKDPVIARQSPS